LKAAAKKDMAWLAIPTIGTVESIVVRKNVHAITRFRRARFLGVG